MLTPDPNVENVTNALTQLAHWPAYAFGVAIVAFAVLCLVTRVRRS
jgi:hypothetical protein